MTAYPSKVARIVRAVEAVGQNAWDGRPWTDVTVEDRDGFWIVSAIRPGNVFTEERLSLYVAVRASGTIAGTDIKLRASQEFRGGHLHRFGDDVRIDGWKTLYRIG